MGRDYDAAFAESERQEFARRQTVALERIADSLEVLAGDRKLQNLLDHRNLVEELTQANAEMPDRWRIGHRFYERTQEEIDRKREWARQRLADFELTHPWLKER